MNLSRWFAIAVLTMGCSYVQAEDDFSCRENRSEVDHRKHASGDATRSLLALAAYLDCAPTIAVDGDTYRPIRHFPSKGDRAYGLAYTVFDKQSGSKGRIDRRIIAYRGTELTHPNDWIFGNLPIIRTQYRIALARFPGELEDLAPGAKVTVLGHSLGGSIAVTMYRYHYDEIDRARAFNSSPLLGCIDIGRGGRKCLRNPDLRAAPNAELRYSEWLNTHEKGDPTRLVGNLMFWKWDAFTPGDDKRWYRRYDFLKSQFIGDHSIQKLTYHLACYGGREDVKLATIAIQCLRGHDGDRSQCPDELKDAKGVIFDDVCACQSGSPTQDGVCPPAGSATR